MIYQGFSKLKPLIGTALLLGLLGAGLMSAFYTDHGAMVQHGCVNVNTGAPSCMNFVDISSCIQAHLGSIQAFSQAIPVSANQLLALLVVAVVLWFGFKHKRGELDALSRFCFWLRGLAVSPNAVSTKVGQWLTLHEKRDPAPTTFMVLGVSFVPIM